MEARIEDVASPSRRFDHGDAVVRQGEIQQCVFLVRAGAVRLAALLPTGRQAIVGVLGPGDLFGEVALLGGASPVEVRAVGFAVVEALPVSALEAIVERSPGCARELLRLLASRLHRTASALEEALSRDVPARLAGTLVELASRHGVRNGAGVRLRLPITQEELGRMVGASRETVNRTLATFAARHLIRIEDGRYLIPNVAALADMAERERVTA